MKKEKKLFVIGAFLLVTIIIISFSVQAEITSTKTETKNEAITGVPSLPFSLAPAKGNAETGERSVKITCSVEGTNLGDNSESYEIEIWDITENKQIGNKGNAGTHTPPWRFWLDHEHHNNPATTFLDMPGGGATSAEKDIACKFYVKVGGKRYPYHVIQWKITWTKEGSTPISPEVKKVEEANYYWVKIKSGTTIRAGPGTDLNDVTSDFNLDINKFYIVYGKYKRGNEYWIQLDSSSSSPYWIRLDRVAEMWVGPKSNPGQTKQVPGDTVNDIADAVEGTVPPIPSVEVKKPQIDVAPPVVAGSGSPSDPASNVQNIHDQIKQGGSGKAP